MRYDRYLDAYHQKKPPHHIVIDACGIHSFHIDIIFVVVVMVDSSVTTSWLHYFLNYYNISNQYYKLYYLTKINLFLIKAWSLHGYYYLV